MKLKGFWLAGLAATVAVAVMLTAFASSPYLPLGNTGTRINVTLTPFEVVSPVYSDAMAHLEMTARRVRGEDGNYGYEVYYTLSWMRLSSPPTKIYIAVGKQGQTGPVIVWLCGGGDKPACPPKTWGEITYNVVPPLYLKAEEIQGVQGVEAGDFEGFMTLLMHNSLYIQIDTEKFPSGEVRAQLTAR
ncbi:MAG: CHRD domain-containing protein [Candidatus Caldarchaeum sp.]